ncbi:MAG: hypothetical protein K5777_01330 [Nitrosopumilus sp.]|nr:hypothetical protein [Nitrosopumilus sp.]
MNFFNKAVIFLILIISMGINSSYGEIDPISDIEFLQEGMLHTEKNQFIISSDLNIREFFNGHIVRVSGQTVEGFPYITYSKISEENIDTYGKIFINGQFVKLSFIKTSVDVEEVKEKQDDLSIVSKYTQRAHSKQHIFLDVKIFERDQNKYNNFDQNYGFISNTNVEVIITNEENQKVFSSAGITNDKGLFETKYLIPDNSKRETLTIEITAENDNSLSSKILQAFALGNISSDSSGP